mmetsp:Transcript_13477/g.19282  ORF Transcript_13477/g.19282 Transcript_13477/m.19282 type:complete len:86 (-) Transcript_13477:269-526(-)
MVHAPSFLVGSICSGMSYLIIHQEISHRNRLSKKWVLTEKIESKMKELMKNANMDIKDIDPKLEVSSREKWNDLVGKLRDLVDKK